MSLVACSEQSSLPPSLPSSVPGSTKGEGVRRSVTSSMPLLSTSPTMALSSGTKVVPTFSTTASAEREGGEEGGGERAGDRSVSPKSEEGGKEGGQEGGQEEGRRTFLDPVGLNEPRHAHGAHHDVRLLAQGLQILPWGLAVGDGHGGISAQQE